MGQDIGYVVLAAAGLGFVGLGIQPPALEWGVMVSDSRQFMLQAWWYALFPGVAIAVAVLGFTLLGNGLQAAFNVSRLSPAPAAPPAGLSHHVRPIGQ